jgi:tetratricopeptide (TPR) repeat protein
MPAFATDRPLPALLPIAELLWEELTAFGVFARELDSPPEGFEDFLLTRHVSSSVLFGQLAERAGLRLVDHKPYLLGLGDWDEDRPLAGYTDHDGAPTPVGAAFSLIVGWRTQSTGDSEGGTFYRTLRSALWIAEHHSIATAVHWALDLLEHGRAAFPREVAHAVAVLLAARSRATTDAEAALKLRGGEPPQDRDAVLAPRFALDWVDLTDLSAEMQALEMTLVERALAVIEEVRSATTLDAWVVKLSGAVRVTNAIRLILSWTNDPLPVTLRGFVSQLEELDADNASIVVSLELGGYPMALEYAKSIADEYKAVLGENWEGRYRKERSLLPHACGALDQAAVPTEWRMPSWRLAQSWTVWHTFEADAMLRRPLLTAGKDDAPTDERRRRLDDALGRAAEQLQQGATSEARTTLADVLAEYPWADPAWWYLAQAAWRDGRADEALEAVTAAIVLRPYEAALWDSLRLVLEDLDSPLEVEIAAAVAGEFARVAGIVGRGQP